VGDLTRQADSVRPAINPADLLASSGSDTTKGKGGKVTKVLSALSAVVRHPKNPGKSEGFGGQQGGQDGEGNRPPRQAGDVRPAIDVEALVAAIGALSPAERLRLLEALAGMERCP
jgi:hypothetical protein